MNFNALWIMVATALIVSSPVMAEAGGRGGGGFIRGDYQEAMRLVNQAIAKKPNDPVPHECRALILFATRQYRPAAAAIYAVLSVGPGWDSATLYSFYPDPNLYTAQLRALEQYSHDNPDISEARFLLAYQYSASCWQLMQPTGGSTYETASHRSSAAHTQLPTIC